MQGEIDIEWVHLEGVLREYGERVVSLYRENMRESGRPASGALADSLRTEVVAGGTTIAVDLSLLEYWKYIEHGTRPHWAPIGPLKEWVKVKRLLPRPNSKIPPTLTLEKAQERIAYAVRWKIHEEGTEGKDDLSRSLQQAWAEFAQRVADAVTADIGDNLDYILRRLLVA